MNIIAFIGLGIVAGLLSGLVGIGGGIIIIPALVFLFGLSQQQAQGTTLALLVPPIGVLAAYTYYRQGYVDIKIALLVCIGFIIGTLPGAKLATSINTMNLQKIFGIGLFLLSLKMLFFH